MTGIVQVGPLWRIASARMPTRWGMFDAVGFERDVSNDAPRVETALAIVMGDLTEGVPLLRIHSQCFTGEVLGSLRCDCRDQLEMAMQAIADEGRGLVIYEYQEGRGIGLMAKLEAYELQDAGLDTVEANHALGFKADCRDFSLPAAILRDLGIKRVRLLSNNPRKARALAKNGVEVIHSSVVKQLPIRTRLLTCGPKRKRCTTPRAFGGTEVRPKHATCARCGRVAPRVSYPASMAPIATERPMSSGERRVSKLSANFGPRRGGKRWMKSLPNDPKASFAFN
jgi:GTP cyclohydrolase II